jgi:hypothetical protein
MQWNAHDQTWAQGIEGLVAGLYYALSLRSAGDGDANEGSTGGRPLGLTPGMRALGLHWASGSESDGNRTSRTALFGLLTFFERSLSSLIDIAAHKGAP